MKFKIQLFIILAFQLLISAFSNSQTCPVFLQFVSHNEDAEPFLTNYFYYIQKRNLIIQLANVVQSRNLKWNFQSDHPFLKAVIKFDTGSTLSNTNGKNLLRWLTEDKGVICDPHSHENGVNYADVAHLQD